MFSLNQKYLKKVLNIHLIIDQKSSKIIYIIGAMKKKTIFRGHIVKERWVWGGLNLNLNLNLNLWI